jgi:hypothetical protein
MNRGKEICNELKAVRRGIAKENDIPLEIPDCLHQGPCPGTCPQCEKELRHLERALAQRISVGKVATVAGIALALASPAAAQVQDTTDKPAMHIRLDEFEISEKAMQGIISGYPATPTVIDPPEQVTFLQPAKPVKVYGTIIDDKTKEPLPLVNVVFKRDSITVLVAVTDFDGIFKTELTPADYTMEIWYVGYYKEERHVTITDKTDLGDIALRASAQLLDGVVIIEQAQPLIEIDPYGNMQHMEFEGVKVNVK